MAKRKSVRAKTDEFYRVLGFRLEMESDTYYNEDGDESGEPWSYRGTTTTDWRFERVTRTDSAPDMLMYLGLDEPLPNDGETLYAVYGIYDTGDSFGTDYSKYCEGFVVYRDHAVAKAAAEILNKTKAYTTALPTGVGDHTVNVHVPWVGYFESLARVEIEYFVYNHKIIA